MDQSLVGGTILRKQTTYIDLITESKSFRIHFLGKREFKFIDDRFKTISVYSEHPLLLDYVEPMMPVHLASPVDDNAKFRGLLEEAAAKVFGKWRSVDRYLNLPLEEFLKKSYGLLMIAPETFARLAAERAEELGVRLIVHDGQTDDGSPPALILDENFVIANEFRVERL